MKTDFWKRAGLILALLAAMLVLMGASNATSAQYGAMDASVSAQSNEFTAVSIPGWVEALPGATGSYGDVSNLNDASGNSFVTLKNEDPRNNNTTWAEIAKYSPLPNSVELGRWFINPGTVTVNGITEPTKIDSVSTFWSGTGLMVDLSVHAIGNTRIRDAQRYIIPNVFNSTGLALQAGGPNAYQPVPQAPQECTPINYNTIQSMITTAKNDTVRELKAAMPEIMATAIASNKVLTEGNTKNYLYQFVLDREYEVFARNIPGFWDYAKTVVPTPRP